MVLFLLKPAIQDISTVFEPFVTNLTSAGASGTTGKENTTSVNIETYMYQIRTTSVESSSFFTKRRRTDT